MNSPVALARRRTRFHGMCQIVCYNRNQYIAACLALCATGAAWQMFRASPWLRAIALTTGALAGWWALASVAVSHWVYDRSELHRWTWLAPLLPKGPGRWLNLHAGLDESTAALRRLFPGTAGTTADFFDASEMPEPSIHRARKGRVNASSVLRVGSRHLPFADRAFETVFLVFAAHELREKSARTVFWREIARVLATDGLVVLVEHLRDAANFCAFGPGCLHFFPEREWRRLAGIAGFRLAQECRITPFVKVLTWKKEP
jgi:SAM-dependent methyltransferase